MVVLEKKRARDCDGAEDEDHAFLKRLCSPAIKSLLLAVEEEEDGGNTRLEEGSTEQQQEELIRSLEEEINLSSASSSPREEDHSQQLQQQQEQVFNLDAPPSSDFSYLLEASDDELGIGFPASPALSEADLSCSQQMPLRGNILDFLDGEVISLDFAELGESREWLNRAVATLDSVGCGGEVGFDSSQQQQQILVETPGLLL